ncbi:unnamed protein product [Mytilus edulis]|uniref:B box-type domain-containing protein n=1 Tax=Mytilus edulis TaxID=6550 RepID=A0A8S3R191_MYTED|nr:unnamed protein product [Mytilus edulis]
MLSGLITSITSTINGNIFAACNRKVVVFRNTDIISIHRIHSTVNDETGINFSFSHSSVVTTPLDNVIVAYCDNRKLSILNNTGHLLTTYNTKDIGMSFPKHLAITTEGSCNIMGSSPSLPQAQCPVQPLHQAQIPIRCQRCDCPKVKWKCEECVLVFCDKCGREDHAVKGHHIIDITTSQVQISDVKEYQAIDYYIKFIAVAHDNSLWMADIGLTCLHKLAILTEGSFTYMTSIGCELYKMVITGC